MTDLLTRPILRVPAPDQAPARPVWLAAVLAALVTALGGLVLCVAVAVAVWLAGDSGSIGGAVRAGALGWLVGNGSSLRAGGASITMLPLGFVAVLAVTLYRGGRWAALTSAPAGVRDCWLAVTAMGAGYAAVSAVAAVMASTPQAAAPLPRTIAATLLLAGGAGGLGVAVATGRLTALRARLPEEVRAAAYGAGIGVTALVLCSAVLFTATLSGHLGRALSLADGLQAGFVGGVVVAAVGLALVPNALLCAGAFIAGPGFAVGTGTTVSPGAVTIGPLPDFPLLAALPTSGPHRWQAALIVLPVLAGAAAGLCAVRRFPAFGLGQVALRGACAGLGGGMLFGLATGLAAGAVGPGRMASFGPNWPATTAVCAVAMLLGGAIAAVAGRWVGEFRQARRR